MMILKPYADADYYSVSQCFPKKEIAKYTNRGGIEYCPSSRYTNLTFTYCGMIDKLLAVE